ncbi:hypothetical protein [Clostridium perfringens]|uniref:Uncharacterized protein n=2 Tax=Clostridium perfringens TaxID=1502 RepID=A0AAP6WNW6_CLOPF|nr:hypothetical protein [Clostridium perfringens]NP_612878.1 Gp49 protein [Clostridium phage phi3626]AAL96818.1 Gp49 protein [Clostridium phage phi3626]EDT22924.1 Gp49 protein [Clostridium perfringens B str. ATCC 3626]NGU30615.1 hypothetical protein [Clostridium perfringens]WEV05028.1 hypothetical protein PL322_13750 [Clostridium perfringens B]
MKKTKYRCCNCGLEYEFEGKAKEGLSCEICTEPLRPLVQERELKDKRRKLIKSVTKDFLSQEMKLGIREFMSLINEIESLEKELEKNKKIIAKLKKALRKRNAKESM